MLGFTEVIFHLAKLVFSLQIVVLYIGELLYGREVSELISLEYLSPIVVFSALGFFASGLILLYRVVSWTCMKKADESPTEAAKQTPTTKLADPLRPDKVPIMSLKSLSQSFSAKPPQRASSDQVEFLSVKRDSRNLIKSVSSGNVVESELKPPGLLVPESNEQLKQASLNLEYQSKLSLNSPKSVRVPEESSRPVEPSSMVEPEQKPIVTAIPFWKNPKKLGFLYCHTYVLSASVIVFMGTFGYIQLANRESTMVWKASVFCVLAHSISFLVAGLLLSSQIKEYLLTKSYSWGQTASKVAVGGHGNRVRTGHGLLNPRLRSQLEGSSVDANNSINPILEEGDQLPEGYDRVPDFHPLNMNSADFDGSSQQYRRQASQAGEEMNPDTPRSVMSSIKSLQSAKGTPDVMVAARVGFSGSVDFELGEEKQFGMVESGRQGSSSASGEENDREEQETRVDSSFEPKPFNAGRKRPKTSIGPSMIDEPDLDPRNSENHEYSHHIVSEPDRESSGPNPIFFYLVLPSASEEEEQLIPLEDLSPDLGIELKQSSLASDDLRVLDTQSMCFDCGSTRPLAISMPCAHGGLCLRCNIKHANKFKQCLYCSKVNLSDRRSSSPSSSLARAESLTNLHFRIQESN